MSLSESQYIEVAEKVWIETLPQLEKQYEDSEFYGTYDEFDFNWWLKHQVNSWQGFGRTVEAIQGLDAGAAKAEILHELSEMLHGWIPISDFIEATHLAALEALK